MATVAGGFAPSARLPGGPRRSGNRTGPPSSCATLYRTANRCSPTLLPQLAEVDPDLGCSGGGLGIAVVVWPGISILVAAIFFGAYLLVTGIAQVVFAFSLHVPPGGRVLLFISGAASVILAVLSFRHLYDAVLLLAIWIGIGLHLPRRGHGRFRDQRSDAAGPGVEHLRRRDQPDRRHRRAGLAVRVDRHAGTGHRYLADRPSVSWRSSPAFGIRSAAQEALAA